MNERPSVNRLREAMRKADYSELEDIAVSIGREAVEDALADEQHSLARALETRPDVKVNEEDRQRQLDAALADAIEAVARHRARVGRRVCIQADGKAVRLIFETLRGMQPETSDQGFPS